MTVQIDYSVIRKIRRVRHKIDNLSVFYQDRKTFLRLHLSRTVQNDSICQCIIHKTPPILENIKVTIHPIGR